MNTLADIFSLMDLHGLYSWSLFGVDARQTQIPLPSYHGPIKSASAGAKTQSTLYDNPDPLVSKEILEKTVRLHPHYTFRIELKSFYKSNSKVGPIEFSLEKRPEVTAPAPVEGLGAVGQMQGFGGLGQMVHRSVLDDRRELERERREIDLERVQVLMDKHTLKSDRERFEEEKRTWEADRKELERKYTDHSNTVSAGILKGFSHVTGWALPNEDGKPIAQLAGKAEEEPLSEEEQIVADMAEYVVGKITDKPTLSWLDLQVRGLVDKVVLRRQQQQQQQQFNEQVSEEDTE